MAKIHILGISAGLESEKNFTTCFILENNNSTLLVDSGSSERVVFNMEKKGYTLSDIHHIFISHKHSDHMLGMIGMMRRYLILFKKGKYEGKLNIYCSKEVKDALLGIYTSILRGVEILDDYVVFNIINDGDVIKINEDEYRVIDCLAKGFELRGFETVINDKRFYFIGDEKLNAQLYDRVKNADYLLHEAFCLEKNRSNPDYGRALMVHGSVLETAAAMEKLGIKNLILYHSADEGNIDRKLEYTNEAKKAFSGTVYVPEDLDTIDIV